MIDYTLAKRLKEAGFPQKNLDKSPFGSVLRDEEVVANPTLSELIEACGDGFVVLERKLTGLWFAQGKGWYANGSTPDIAVANLYLALNEKEK